MKVKSKPSLSAVGGSGSSGSGAAANGHRDDDTSSDHLHDHEEDQCRVSDYDDEREGTFLDLMLRMPSGDTFPVSITLYATGFDFFKKIRAKTMLREEEDCMPYFYRPHDRIQINDDWCMICYDFQNGDIIDIELHTPRVINMAPPPSPPSEEVEEVEEVEVTAPKVLKTFRSVLAVTASK